MKKLVKLICLAAILCVAYLALTTPQGEDAPAMKTIEADEETDQAKAGNAEADQETDRTKADNAEADEIADRVKAIGEDAVRQADEFIGDAVRQADETLEDAVEQADKAIGDAVESAAEGAKQGFIESLKKSADEFWEKLFSQEKE